MLTELDSRPRHLQIQARDGVGDRVASRVPVGDEHAVPAPLLAQNATDQRRVAGAVDAVDAVVSRHHRPRAGAGHGLERQQIDLAQCPLVDDAVDRRPVRLRIVGHEMLGTRGDGLGLHARDVRHADVGRELRILGVALEVTAAERGPDEIEHGPEHVVDAGPLRFRPYSSPDFSDQADVPGRAHGDAAGCASGARTRGQADGPDAVGAVEGEHGTEAYRFEPGRMPGIDPAGQPGSVFDAQRSNKRVETLDRYGEDRRVIGRLRHFVLLCRSTGATMIAGGQPTTRSNRQPVANELLPKSYRVMDSRLDRSAG